MPYEAVTAASKFLDEILFDYEWHEMDDLIKQLIDAEVELPVKYSSKTGSLLPVEARARYAVTQKTQNLNHWDKEVAPGKTRGLKRVRRKKLVGLVKTCAVCGKSGLDRTNRVRKEVVFRVAKSANGGHAWDWARLKTLTYCIDCAVNEVEVNGGTFNKRFLQGGTYGTEPKG